MKGKQRYAKCICSYVEGDSNGGTEYWTKGKLYEFHRHRFGKEFEYQIETNFERWGYMGYGYGAEFEDYFEIVWE